MIFAYDVWANFVEGEENRYNIPEFFEWRKEDGIELIEQLPVLKVSGEFYGYIEDGLSELPEELIEKVKNKSYIRKNNEREKLECCFILSDGVGVLVVDTIGYEIPMRKSKLIARQEELILQMVKELEVWEFKFKPEKNEYHILSPNPEFMIGLTRRERNLKQILFMALDQLEEGVFAKLLYYYIEWNPNGKDEIKNYNYKELYDKFLKEISNGWTENHERLCEIMIKGQPFFEKLYEIETEEV